MILLHAYASHKPRNDTHHASQYCYLSAILNNTPERLFNMSPVCPLSSRSYLRHNSLCVPPILLTWVFMMSFSTSLTLALCMFFSMSYSYGRQVPESLTRFSLSSSPRLNSLRTTRFGYHFETVEMQDLSRCSGGWPSFQGCEISLYLQFVNYSCC